MQHIDENGERTPVYAGDIQPMVRDWEPLHGEGFPNPSEIIRNIENLGYSSPRVEYVESASPVTLKDLADKWGVNYATIQAWGRKQDWKGQRERYMRQVELASWDEAPDVLARVRDAARERHRSQWVAAQAFIMEKLKADTKITFSPKGDMFETTLGANDVRALAQGLALAIGGEERALGIDLPAGKVDASAGEVKRGGGKQIEVHVVRRDDIIEAQGEPDIDITPDDPTERFKLPAIGAEYD